MNNTRSKYQVHAVIQGVNYSTAHFDDAEAGFPLERRLNRIERVVASYRGKIDRRFKNGLLTTFDTADAALLGACEMQLRCAVLPQVSKHRLALRIGIHQGVVRQRAIDDTDNTPEVAERLAVVDNGILVSGLVIDALNPELRKISRPVEYSSAELATHKIDWRSEIPSAAYGGESFWPTNMGSLPIGPYLLLHYGMKTLDLTLDNPTVTIGRDPQSDLVLSDIHVSRNHCQIERRENCIVLTDTSTNGTTVLRDGASELLVKNSNTILKGKGLLFFGRPFNSERRGGVRYESN